MTNGSVTVIRGARLIDGSGDAPLDAPVIVVRGTKIEAVLRGEPPAGILDEAEQVLDLAGCTAGTSAARPTGQRACATRSALW